jgi:hypothetical protein
MDMRPPASGSESGAARGPSARSVAIWLLGALILILLIFGWIVALMCIVGLFCVGFLLSLQKREERQNSTSTSPYPRSTDSENGPSSRQSASGGSLTKPDKDAASDLAPRQRTASRESSPRR